MPSDQIVEMNLHPEQAFNLRLWLPSPFDLGEMFLQNVMKRRRRVVHSSIQPHLIAGATTISRPGTVRSRSGNRECVCERERERERKRGSEGAIERRRDRQEEG